MSEGNARVSGESLSWSGMSDQGRFRQSNEDAFLALTFDAREVRRLGKVGSEKLDSGDFIFAVSDGMGGAKAGEFASRIAVEKITELLPKSFRYGALGLDRGCSQILHELFEQIHREMVRMAIHYEECRGMGATLSLCWFAPEAMHFAHVGDSRIYYQQRASALRQISHDHTAGGRLVRAGRISEYEARRRPDANVLDQALGGKTRTVEPQFGSVIFERGDRFALCSDGVSNGISARRIETLLTDPPPRFASLAPARRLVQDSLEEYGRDNSTALVIEVA